MILQVITEAKKETRHLLFMEHRTTTIAFI